MILYHYSNSDFDNFKISEQLTITHYPVEGIGIYLLDNPNDGDCYGSICYKCNVKNVIDFTDYSIIKSCIDKLDIIYNLYELLGFEKIDELIKDILIGYGSIVKLPKEILLYLDAYVNVWFDDEQTEKYYYDCKNIFPQTYRYFDKNMGQNGGQNVYICKNINDIEIVEKIK